MQEKEVAAMEENLRQQESKLLQQLDQKKETAERQLQEVLKDIKGSC